MSVSDEVKTELEKVKSVLRYFVERVSHYSEDEAVAVKSDIESIGEDPKPEEAETPASTADVSSLDTAALEAELAKRRAEAGGSSA